MKIDSAYLISQEDFTPRNWIDWIKSHLILRPPSDRFKRSFLIDYKGITFCGCYDYIKEVTEFTIRKDEITQLYYGYDNTFSTFQTRRTGLS